MRLKQTGKQDTPYIPWLLQGRPQDQLGTNPPNPRWYRSRWRLIWRGVLRHGFRLLAIVFTLLMLGRNSFTPVELIERSIHSSVKEWDFNLLSWEVESSRKKAGFLFNNPTLNMSETESAELVCIYMKRSDQIVTIERRLAKDMASEKRTEEDAKSSETMQDRLESLRNEQLRDRGLVETIIQKQIGHELLKEGLQFSNRPFPPVLFSFTEPPKKMVVSPRNKIETVYSRMLDATIDLQAIDESEQRILDEHDLSTYITNIGGLGAFPTMVIDRASLAWVLSTVAHEWTHNYLATYPLGLSYAQSSDITILNETVAEIVGNEIGERALARYYPDPQLCRSSDLDDSDDTEEEEMGEEEAVFDFRTEMRETRLTVDELLADGLVKEAELYMELRRLDFVENGFALRVLNQAYFAFHGNYGTSAASSSPIGPKLVQMREKSPTLAGFLRDVRWFVSLQDVDDFLSEEE